jgi:predicted CXXCH cytochrome family protein
MFHRRSLVRPRAGPQESKPSLSSWRRRAIVLLACLSGSFVMIAGLTFAQPPPKIPQYVGSQACSGCHVAQTKAWSGSDHAWAWKRPDNASVLGNFDDASFTHGGRTTRFYKRDGKFFIETESADGKDREFDVKFAVGVEPLQQYLLETETGRLQVPDLAWDTENKRWYHLYPDQRLEKGDGLHWTGPYKNWNARCAECHATGYKKNFDPKTQRYSSTEAEIGVGCEACHGPGEAHLAWANDPESYKPSEWPQLTPEGLTIGFKSQYAEAEIQQCAGCHARREAFADGNPLPGTPFHDAYRLALLRPGLYHADGSIEDEVYVYGSFLQSKMYAKGVRCTDCHDPHAAKLKAKGNAVCTQCHSPSGNPRFPSLRKTLYDDPSHHFHATGSAGAQCKSCHMIERTYMGVDGRRDHSFRIPRPDLSAETAAPNACTDCHSEKEPSWAAAEIARRFPDARHRGSHFSQTFAKARNDPASASTELLELANDKSEPAIIRATALDLLAAAATPAAAEKSAALIADPDPLVREAAIGLQRGAPAQESVLRILPALEDKRKSVRIAAARELLGAPIASLPNRNLQALKKAQGEWRASLLAKMDFPETHMVLGGMALVLRNPRVAEQAFLEAAQQDPQLVDAWRMVARIRAAMGDAKGARQAVEDGISKNPQSDVLRSLRAQFE